MKKYVVFEGIAGSGKSTILSMTKKWLIDKKGLKVHSFEEPSDRIRKILGTYGIDDRIDTLLFVADRLIQQKSLKEIDDDVIVLAERCFLSTIAYQRSILIGNLFDLHDFYLKVQDLDMELTSDTFIFPDAVIILDVPAKLGLERKGGNYEKWENPELLEDVRLKFKQMTIDKKYPFYIYFLDATGPIDEVFEQVKKIVEHELER
ncbi:MAG: dTMP kinase [Candidatus Helarchaeales archaeon]